MPALQLRTCLDKRFHSRGARGDGKHAKTMDAKMSLVNFPRPRRFICEQLAVERRLSKRSAHNRHGATVGFEEEICPLALAGGIWKFQGEHPIWDDAKFSAALNLHPPSEWLLFRAKPKLVFIEKPDIALFPAREFNRHHHVCHEQRVFKIYPANDMVFLIP